MHSNSNSRQKQRHSGSKKRRKERRRGRKAKRERIQRGVQGKARHSGPESGRVEGASPRPDARAASGW
eukprot:9097748-Lingulodinium_polyedra.AAC.1